MNEDDKNQVAADYVIQHLEEHFDYATVVVYVGDKWGVEIEDTDCADIQSRIHQKLRELMKYV